ncbi:MAG: FtsQ-type POTRA domain-containing protein [Sporolactobacillus sp.]
MARKIISLEDRLPQLKAERKRKANRRLVFYASIFFLLILFVIYFQSPLSRVHDFTVIGNQIADRQTILTASGITADTHVWDVHAKEAARRIEALPSVRQATVTFVLPLSVVIRVKEYERKAYLLKNGRYFPILENGQTLASLAAQKVPADAPILEGFTRRKALQAVAEGLSKIPLPIVHSISDIHYSAHSTAGDDLLLYMNDGNRVVASTATFAKKIVLYPEIAANLPKGQTGTIHLSVGSYFVADK